MNKIYSMELMISPKPPFDFGLSATIFAEGGRQIRRYADGRYWQVIRVNNKPILITISSLGTVEKPELLVELKSSREISDDDETRAEETINSLFNLRLELSQFYEEIKNDDIISGIARRLRGLKSPTTETVFEALIDSIIEQQIALNVAHSIEVKIVKTFGNTLDINGDIYYAFPTPQALASTTIEQIRKCGLSQRKSEYITSISKLVADKKLDLDRLKLIDDTKEIIRELDEVRGIGVWTAELTMLRGMHRLEVIPADDLGVRRCISHYYYNDRKISARETRMIAEKWGRWKGLARFYIIVAERLIIKM